MKKLLRITIMLLVLSGAGFWGYICYQRHQAGQTPISRQADAVVRINVYGIYRSMLGEELKKKKGSPSWLKGIEVPSDIFLFTIRGKAATTWFCILHVADKKKLALSLSDREQWTPVAGSTEGPQLFISKDSHWILAYHNPELALAYSLNKEPVQVIVAGLLDRQNTRPLSESPFKHIREQDGHITFLSDECSGSMDFNKGNICATLSLAAKDMTIPKTIQHPAPGPGDAVSMWFYGDLKKMLAGKVWSVDTFRICGDSLAASGLQGFALYTGPPALQRDSSVSYAYNDDFEKVATVTTSENLVPGIRLDAEVDAGRLYHYLQGQGIISPEGKLNKGFFPLYTVHAASGNKQFRLSTLKDETTSGRQQVTGPDFFGLKINFEQLRQQKEYAILFPYIRAYRQLEMKAVRDNQEHIKIDATLYFREAGRQALSQLLENL